MEPTTPNPQNFSTNQNPSSYPNNFNSPNNQNDPNHPSELKKTLWISVVAIIIVALLVWAGIYMYNHRGTTSNGTTGTAATSTNGTSTYMNLGEDNRVVTNDERVAVGSYLSAHINELSPKKAVSGRNFTVTNVNVEAAGRATVEYTDGATDYAAAIKYSIDPSGTVVVDNFDILEK